MDPTAVSAVWTTALSNAMEKTTKRTLIRYKTRGELAGEPDDAPPPVSRMTFEFLVAGAT
jgi:hypothetical protein